MRGDVFDVSGMSDEQIASTVADSSQAVETGFETSDFGSQEARQKLGQSALNVSDEIIGGSVSAIQNRRGREAARELAETARADQLLSERQWGDLKKKDLRTQNRSQSISEKRDRDSLRYQRYMQFLDKRGERTGQMNDAITQMGDLMKSNDSIKTVMLNNFKKEGE
jgi:hypothetical protein